MGPFITETWLRETCSLEYGAAIDLPVGARLTPAARGLLDERRITVTHGGHAEQASAPGKASAASVAAPDKHINPLTGSAERFPSECQMCHQAVGQKPDTLTHLDARTLAPKNDPRLVLRGKLDTAIAHAVLAQTEFDPHGRYPQLAPWLADVRSALGCILRSEVTGEIMPPIRMGGLDEDAIHALSHNPLKYLGQDHMVPEAAHGLAAARLNLLRAVIREAEIAAAAVYINRDFTVGRPDIMRALNRLSSAVYVLVILVYLAEHDRLPEPERMTP